MKLEKFKAQWGTLKFLFLDWQKQGIIPSSKEIQSKKNTVTDKSKKNVGPKLIEETTIEWALKKLIREFSNLGIYDMILYLAEVCLSLPITNAWPERGASAVKRLKTRLRSTMSNDLLQSLLHISINGPEMYTPEYDDIIKRAVVTWHAKVKRKKGIIKVCKPQVEIASVSESGVQCDLGANATGLARLDSLIDEQAASSSDPLETVVAKQVQNFINFSDIDSCSDSDYEE